MFFDHNTLFLYAPKAKKVVLELYEKASSQNPSHSIALSPEEKLGDYWTYPKSIPEGSLYKWNVDGCSILDPYAKSYSQSENREEKKSIFVKSTFQNKKARKRIPREEQIIYEAHIGFFTGGKGYREFQEKIPYLQDLGINVVEFLPVFEWDEYTGNFHQNGKPLINAWGYNPINFFAASKKFSTAPADSFQEKKELQELIKALHEAGMEVLLDVVYNHTAEGGLGGPCYHFKALEENVFYIKDRSHNFANYSGTGNTLNTNHNLVKEMIIDSLLYWFVEMDVDGFRFDLNPILGRDSSGQWMNRSLLHELKEHPILSKATLISESWDLGGYFVGAMPSAWAEWNGLYRDTLRKFIKGDFGQVPDLIKRICGSVDVFHANSLGYQASINFICCHDGFTLWDLVSYNIKHNRNNGEENRDGENHNLSYNHGVEGETKDPEILRLRKQQVKNFLLILFISQGVPMLLMGDEAGRTQLGNNNAYCHNNEITWFDWERKKEFEDIFSFSKAMIALRKKYEIFRKKEALVLGEDLILHGVKLHQPDFSFHSLSIALEYYDKKSDTQLYIALNSYVDTLEFELPPCKEETKEWTLFVDTSLPLSLEREEKKVDTPCYSLAAKSALILISKKRS